MSFLTNNLIKYVIIDYRCSKVIKRFFEKRGINIIPCMGDNIMYDAVKGHPDIYVHPISNNFLISSINTYEYFNNIGSKIGLRIERGSTKLKGTYPYNISYNIARVGNLAFHNTKYTDKRIIELFKINNIRLINVKQGYTKCSTCIVSKNAIITSDKGIAKAAEKNGLDVLLIRPGYINLKGMDYGFIGGASGVISDCEIFFSGNIEKHPDYIDIYNFCKNHKKKLVYPKDIDLTDIGSIIPIC